MSYRTQNADAAIEREITHGNKRSPNPRPSQGGAYAKPMAEERRPVFAAVPLNHSELTALKKVCGADRATIEQAADEEGVSLETYIKKLIAGHAKDLRG